MLNGAAKGSRINFLSGLLLASLFLGGGCGPRDSGKLPPRLPEIQRESRQQVRKQQLLSWTRDELLQGYEKAGKKSELWDRQARNLFEAFAELHANGNPSSDLVSNVKSAAESAINAGCTDPLVRYFYVRQVLAVADFTTNTIPAQLNEISKEISASDYPDLRKYYAALRAAQELGRIRPRSQTEAGERLRDASDALKRFLATEPSPADEAYLAATDLIATANNFMPEAHRVWDEIDPSLKKRLKDSPEYHMLRGEEYIRYAWKGRGGGFADKVTSKGWKLFAERLKIAHTELLKAYEFDPYNPRIAQQMIEVCVGRELPREQMEIWFARGMIADSNNIPAIRAKLRYLGPNWYGSAEQMIAFGRECIRNPAWGPTVPLEIIQIHSTISGYEKDWRPYYKRPEVYQDIRDAYVEYFRRNPEDIGERQNWLRYAYLAGDVSDARQQYVIIQQKIDPNAYATPELYQEVKNFMEKAGPLSPRKEL